MLKITLNRGLVGKRETQRKVVQALGLGKQNSSVTRPDTQVIRGMINKVSHLLHVESISECASSPKQSS